MRILGKSVTLQRILPWILIVCGSIGLICALVIMYDKMQLALNPDFTPGCDLNPVISCGSVMQSWQATAFWNIPNPYIGMAAFPVVIATGAAILAGARQLKRWYWLGLETGTIFGVLFVHWLFYQSVYSINALCPYCMAVWAMTITLFWYVTLYNIQAGHIRLKGRLSRAAFFARRHHLDILLFWLLLIAFFILKHFWYYYGDRLF